MIFSCRKRQRVTGGEEIVIETVRTNGIVKSISVPMCELKDTTLEDIISKFFNVDKEVIYII